MIMVHCLSSSNLKMVPTVINKIVCHGRGPRSKRGPEGATISFLRSLDKGASDLKSGGSCGLSGLLLINTQHNSEHVVVDRTVI